MTLSVDQMALSNVKPRRRRDKKRRRKKLDNAGLIVLVDEENDLSASDMIYFSERTVRVGGALATGRYRR